VDDAAREPDEDITALLGRMGAGDAAAERTVFERLQGELRALAAHFLAHQGEAHSLQASALVNEVYLRLHRGRGPRWENRRHFLGVAARAMRSILVDHARGRRRLKRVPPGDRVSLSAVEARPGQPALDLVALDDALEELARVDPFAVQVVEHRWFLGLPFDEVAEALGTPLRTVERRWRLARAYLHGRLA